MSRKIVMKQCLNCGKDFETTASQVNVGKGKFCSYACRNIFTHTGKSNPKARLNIVKAREALKGKSAWNKKDKITLTCHFCGNPYEVHPFKQNTSKFCSRECSYKYKASIKGTEHPLWKRQLRTCEWCGKEVWVKPSILHTFRFCSLQCTGAWVNHYYRNPTKSELMMKEALEGLNIPFETEYRIGKYSCDFALPEYHLVIEVDGDYWHSLPKRRELDKVKDDFLKAEGWKVIRFKELDVYHDPSKCLIKISKYIGFFPA